MYSTVMSETAWYEKITQLLGRSMAADASSVDDRKPAAVALILRQTGDIQELLFIERAHHPDDPWSGNIGFPGGRWDVVDATLRHTAERETMEEVGIDLSGASYLGRLSDIVGANLPVRVSCFVYALAEPVELVLSHEVHDIFWFALHELAAPQRQLTAQVRFGGKLLEAPAIDLGLPDKAVLWGITYRLVNQFREVMESGEERQLPYVLPL